METEEQVIDCTNQELYYIAKGDEFKAKLPRIVYSIVPYPFTLTNAEANDIYILAIQAMLRNDLTDAELYKIVHKVLKQSRS